MYQLLNRAWRSDEVRDAVCRLALIVRHYCFGPDDCAIVAAQLLAQSEPLEQLDADDLAVKKMRALTSVVYRRYDEALDILEPLRAAHADDRFICGLHRICIENRPKTKQRAKKPRAR
jgi:hypothetical protein